MPEESSLSRAWRSHVWLLFLLLNAAICVAYFVWDTRWTQAVLYEIPLVGAAAALLVPGLKSRREGSSGWRWLSASMVMQIIGDIVYDALSHVSTRDVSIPSAADVFYVGSSGMLIVGVWVLARAHGGSKDTEGALDGLTLALSLLILAAGPFAQHNVSESRASIDSVMTALYPALDIIAVAIVVRLYIVRTRSQSLPALLLTAGALATLAGDLTYAWVGSQGYTVDSLVNSTWMLQATLIGAAALHPAGRQLTDPLAEGNRTNRARLILLGVSLLALPLDSSQFSDRSQSIAEEAIRATARVALAVLVLARIVLYLRRAVSSAARLLESERQLSNQAMELEAVRAADAERDRIGHELSSRVVQRLFAAGMQVQATIGGVQNPELRERMSRSVTEIDTAISELRSAVFTPTPASASTSAPTSAPSTTGHGGAASQPQP